MRKALLISIAMVALLAMTIVPTYAFVIPPNPSGEDNNYELYGPHVKGLNIIVYSDTTAEWNAMSSGALDLEDWALDPQHVASYGTTGGPFTEVNTSDVYYFILDINNNATFTPSDSIPGTHNPTSELPLRQAITYCVNRSDIVALSGGSAIPIYTPMPTYMAGYVNTQIAPGQSLENLTYGGLYGNLTAANAILDANGYTIDGSGWRIDPVSQGGTGAELNLIFHSSWPYAMRGLASQDINTALNSVHIRTAFYNHATRDRSTINQIFYQEYFNLYIDGWVVGPDPDYLCDLYNGSNYYHPGSPPNYDGINYADLNLDLTTIKLAPTLAIGTAATLDAQVKFAEHAAAVPLWCESVSTAYKNVPVEGGGNWTNLVNERGTGVHSWWSTLDKYQQGNLYPDKYANYGFSSWVEVQNIVYVQWFWDQEVLGRIYDSGAARDPMTFASWVPQLYKSWTVGTWSDPSAGGENKTSVTITLRPDIYWQDGQPFTAADVYYTLVEISKDLLAKGFPPPSWYPTVQYMRSVEIIDDYNIQILLDVQSVWAVGWVIGSVAIPKHIWKPIVDASTVGSTNPRNADAVTPEPYVIGTGPFRWYSGVGGASGQIIVLVANSPGSSAPDPATGLTPIISPGYYFFNPVYVDVNPPGGLSKVNISPTAPNANVPVTITLRDMDTRDSLTVNKYVYLNGVLQPGFPHDVTLAPMLPWNVTYMYPADPLGSANVETLTLTLAKKTLTFIKVAVHVKGPATLADGEANPWISTWVNVTIPIWVTIAKDISGTTLYDVLGYTGPAYPAYLKSEAPAPDLKVDGKDIAGAALAFGTVPGDPRWNTVADLNHDFKVDGRDIAQVALNFGY